jgi:transposase
MKAFERDYGANPFTGEIREKSTIVSSIDTDLLHALQDSNRRVKALEKLMMETSKGDSVIPLLQTIPGIGPVTAFALRYKIDILERFKDSRHLCSYFGFGVRERQSGDTKVKGKIAKTGDPLIRKLLIQGAQVVRALRPDCIPLFFPALGAPAAMQDKKHANKVITALARKNLTFVYFIWKNKIAFDLGKYCERRLQQTALRESDTISSSLLRPSSVAELV